MTPLEKHAVCMTPTVNRDFQECKTCIIAV